MRRAPCAFSAISRTYVYSGMQWGAAGATYTCAAGAVQGESGTGAADVTRAMEKAQEAVARIAPKVGAATTETGDNSCVAEAPGARAAAA